MGLRHSSDLKLLWLWSKPAATALIGPLAWEPPCAKGVALEKTKKIIKKDQKKIKKIRTRHSCMTSGSSRIASGHWVGDGISPAFRFRPRAKFEDCPSADLNTLLIGYQGGTATPRKEEVGSSNPHFSWMIKL